jgi:hypothetical protein
MGRKMRAAQTLYGDEVGGAIVPVEEGDFITELAREVLRGAELDNLQSLFADELRWADTYGVPESVRKHRTPGPYDDQNGNYQMLAMIIANKPAALNQANQSPSIA